MGTSLEAGKFCNGISVVCDKISLGRGPSCTLLGGSKRSANWGAVSDSGGGVKSSFGSPFSNLHSFSNWKLVAVTGDDLQGSESRWPAISSLGSDWGPRCANWAKYG